MRLEPLGETFRGKMIFCRKCDHGAKADGGSRDVDEGSKGNGDCYCAKHTAELR